MVLGIDIGGTNVAIGIVCKSGDVLYETNFKTKDFNDPSQLINKIYESITATNYLSQLLGIGIGAPNGNCITGNIEFAPNLPWKGIIPIAQMFSEKFNIKTIVANDANAAAVGEKLFGIANSFSDFITITLGTGLGSGIFINNKLVEGKHGFAGELGHVQVVENGRECNCGRFGCLETYASSTGVCRSFLEFSKEKNYYSTLYTMSNPSAYTIFEAAKSGDELAIKVVDFTADILGKALASFCNFSDPEAFVLFGGIAQSGDFFLHKVKDAFKNNVYKLYQGKVQILNSNLHHKNAAILGVAASVYYSLS